MEITSGSVLGIAALIVSGVFAYVQRSQAARQRLSLYRLKGRLAKAELVANRRGVRLRVALAALAALRSEVERNKKQIVDDLTAQMTSQANSIAAVKVQLEEQAHQRKREQARRAGRTTAAPRRAARS